MDLRSRHDIISLCSGIGGLDLGIKLAIPLARTVCYVEREVFCCAHLVQKMEEGILDEAPVWTDVKTFDGKPWHGLVDGIHGGYPCQPFSVAGKRKGTEDPRHLWPDIARIVREVQPGWCFFENVRGHLRLGFEQVRDDLREMGYTVRAGLFSAAEVGASHKRERLFILAHSSKARLQGSTKQVIHGQRRREEGRGPSSNGTPRVFPPGPGDRAAWAAILREWPELAPAVDDTQIRAMRLNSQDKGAPNRDGDSPDDTDTHLENPSRTTERERGRGRVSQTGNELADPRHAEPSGRELQKDSDEGKKPRYAPQISPASCSPQIPMGQETKPTVRGVADGATSRVDRLRACGNAIIPLVAAKAFITLAGDC